MDRQTDLQMGEINRYTDRDIDRYENKKVKFKQ